MNINIRKQSFAQHQIKAFSIQWNRGVQILNFRIFFKYLLNCIWYLIPFKWNFHHSKFVIKERNMLCSTIGGAFSYTLCFTPYQLCIVVKLTRASAQFFVQLLIKTLLSFFFLWQTLWEYTGYATNLIFFLSILTLHFVCNLFMELSENYSRKVSFILHWNINISLRFPPRIFLFAQVYD